MHLTSRNELALSKDLLEKPVAISGLFGIDHIGQEGNTWQGPSS
jgi:hypothetical protein